MKTKITTIIGTRPEIIRMSEMFKRFDQIFEHRVIHTGQNFDKNLSQLFFDSMNIRRPNLELKLDSTSLAAQLADIFLGIEQDLIENRPDAVVILGDTNSGLSAIIAKRMSIPVYHLEAGNRSFDINVPEETNRRIIDHTSDFNLVYSESARRNLLSEGLHPRTICLIGSPMNEVINANKDHIENSGILERIGVNDGDFFLCSMHRQENINSADRLRILLESLNQLANKYDLPIIVSAHPRMKSTVEKSEFIFHEKIKFLEPFSFYDYCKLQQKARVVLSDSGSLSEEASILNFPAVTLRDSMERPEALETGSVLMAGLDFQSINEAIVLSETSLTQPKAPVEYEILDSSERTTRFIVSTLGRYNFWSGRR